MTVNRCFISFIFVTVNRRCFLSSNLHYFFFNLFLLLQVRGNGQVRKVQLFCLGEEQEVLRASRGPRRHALPRHPGVQVGRNKFEQPKEKRYLAFNQLIIKSNKIIRFKSLCSIFKKGTFHVLVHEFFLFLHN
jgi:hypothetical protein